MLRAGFVAAAAAAAIAFNACASTAAGANPALLFEPDTGRVLHAEEPDRAWHPASITKLMTAYLTFEAVHSGSLAWDAEVPLSEHARGQPATRVGLRTGIKLNVEQAVRGLVLRSANDFATALAERIGGTEEKFVEAMNATAKRLGMSRTVFRNPHGLPDPEQVTTARDLAILTAALLKDFPDRAEVFSTPTVRIHKGTFYSQNDLLRTLPGADGMKTGFTCASGYNVVASATRQGHRLIAIVLGALNRQKRSERAAELLEAGFAHLGIPAEAAGEASLHRVSHGVTSAHAADGGARPNATVSIMPMALSALAAAPQEVAAAAGDISRQIRSGKCRGYGGFARKGAEPPVSEAETDDEVSPVATGAIETPVSAQATPPKAVAVKSTQMQAAAKAASSKPAGPKKIHVSKPEPPSPDRARGD